jgi:hypothetical protein
MLDKELHAEKVTILSRLIKESSLTLEEALLLLREGEEEKEENIKTSSLPLTGYVYANGTIGTGTTTPTSRMTIGSNGTVTFSSSTDLIAENSADLNT